MFIFYAVPTELKRGYHIFSIYRPYGPEDGNYLLTLPIMVKKHLHNRLTQVCKVFGMTS